MGFEYAYDSQANKTKSPLKWALAFNPLAYLAPFDELLWMGNRVRNENMDLAVGAFKSSHIPL